MLSTRPFFSCTILICTVSYQLILMCVDLPAVYQSLSSPAISSSFLFSLSEREIRLPLESIIYWGETRSSWEFLICGRLLLNSLSWSFVAVLYCSQCCSTDGAPERYTELYCQWSSVLSSLGRANISLGRSNDDPDAMTVKPTQVPWTAACAIYFWVPIETTQYIQLVWV